MIQTLGESCFILVVCQDRHFFDKSYRLEFEILNGNRLHLAPFYVNINISLLSTRSDLPSLDLGSLTLHFHGHDHHHLSCIDKNHRVCYHFLPWMMMIFSHCVILHHPRHCHYHIYHSNHQSQRKQASWHGN